MGKLNELEKGDLVEFLADSAGVAVVTVYVAFVGAWTLRIMGVLSW